MADKRRKTETVHAKENLYDKASSQTYSEDKYNAKGEVKHVKGANIQEDFKKSMAPGGGTPVGNGQWDKDTEEAKKGWNKAVGRGSSHDLPEVNGRQPAKNRAEHKQPRTDDGQFTFNSAAGKGLSKYSDPTRNHTVNPLLVDGQNNVDKDEFRKQLNKGEGPLFDAFKKWRDEALVAGGKYAYQNEIYSINEKTALKEFSRIAGIVYGEDKEGNKEAKTYTTSWVDSRGNKHYKTHTKHGEISTSEDYSKPIGYEVTAKAKMQDKKTAEEKKYIKENKLRKNVFSNVSNTGEYLTKKSQGGAIFGQIKNTVVGGLAKFSKKILNIFNSFKKSASSIKKEAKQESTERVNKYKDFQF